MNAMILFVSLLLGVVSAACTEDVNTADPLSHEIVWESDTLSPEAFELIGKCVWGSSDTNVYVGAHDGGAHQSLQRYNGKKWTIIDLFGYGMNTIESIDGVDESMFAVAGGSRWTSVAIYQDGVWDTLSLPRLSPYNPQIDVVSRSEVYIAVRDGVLKYDGDSVAWIVDSSSVEYNEASGDPFFPRSIVKGNDGMLYFTTMRIQADDKLIFQLYMYDGERASIVEETHSTSPATSQQKAGLRLRKIGNNIVTGYRELYDLSNGKLTKIYDIEEGHYAGSDIYKNFFVATNDYIKHYNGDTWEDITPDGIRLGAGGFYVFAMYYIDRVLYVVGSHGRYDCVVYRGKHI